MKNKILLFITQLIKGNTPARMIARYYLMIMLIGGLLLFLPISHNPGQSISFLDALFTAVSAASVTGLTVVSTINTYNIFGQIIILILIKCGGLGVMVLKLGIWIFLGKKVGFIERNSLMNEQNQVSVAKMFELVIRILIISTAIELIGTLLLAGRVYFSYDYSLGKSLWIGLFHSISATNNSGFDIFGNSLINFVHDYYIQTVIMGLIIFGGIGFPVIYEVFAYFKARVKGKLHRFSLFTKLTVSTYFIVLFIGFILIFISEWDHSFKNIDYNIFDKIFIALFHSVSSRNAGFNTVGMDTFSQASIIIMTIMMFIGASPSSTGGGIRTTTFALCVMFLFRGVHGETEISIFKRKVPNSLIIKALVTFIAGILLVFTSTILILLSHDKMSISTVLFEVTSAFGTTGLSVLGSQIYNSFSKLVLIFTMYIGQIGLSTFILIWQNKKKSIEIEYPEESVLIG